MTNPIKKWHEIIKSGSVDLLSDIISDECIFYSPVVFSPQEYIWTGTLLDFFWKYKSTDVANIPSSISPIIND